MAIPMHWLKISCRRHCSVFSLEGHWEITTSIPFTDRSRVHRHQDEPSPLVRAPSLARTRVFRKAVTHARTTEKYLVRRRPRLWIARALLIHRGFYSRTWRVPQVCLPSSLFAVHLLARGLAWRLWFTDPFLFTGDRFFLETSERCARYTGNTLALRAGLGLRRPEYP